MGVLFFELAHAPLFYAAPPLGKPEVADGSLFLEANDSSTSIRAMKQPAPVTAPGLDAIRSVHARTRPTENEARGEVRWEQRTIIGSHYPKYESVRLVFYTPEGAGDGQSPPYVAQPTGQLTCHALSSITDTAATTAGQEALVTRSALPLGRTGALPLKYHAS